jgi:predicted Rossmann fold nucleotide-binding protein DprA/Smf involved in DNA uptake
MSLNSLICEIIDDYVSHGGTLPSNGNLDIEIMEYTQRRNELLEQQNDFIDKLRQLMQSVSQQQKPEAYKSKQKRILAAFGKAHLTLNELHEKTQLPEKELIVILANLMEQTQISYDKYMRYYKL